MGLYIGTNTSVNTLVGTSYEFNFEVGVHQVLSPLLFIIVMAEATRGQNWSSMKFSICR